MKGMIKSFDNGWPFKNPKGKVAWLKDNWLTFGVQASIDVTGTFAIMMYMKGIWKDAMGIPGFRFGNLWMRLATNIPTCQAAIAAAAGGPSPTAGVGTQPAASPADTLLHQG